MADLTNILIMSDNFLSRFLFKFALKSFHFFHETPRELKGFSDTVHACKMQDLHALNRQNRGHENQDENCNGRNKSIIYDQNREKASRKTSNKCRLHVFKS